MTRGTKVLLAVNVLVWVAVFYAIAGDAREKEEIRARAIEARTLRAIAHTCAPWKDDSNRFADCGVAYRDYEVCEIAWARARERNGSSRPTSGDRLSPAARDRAPAEIRRRKLIAE